MLRGRDIKRYSHEFADLWLINTHNGIKEKGIKPVDIDNYPIIKKHLDKFYPQLEKRTDKGDSPYNLRNCAYMEDFSKQKILWAETMRIHKNTEEKFPRFGLDLSGNLLTDKTCFFASGKDITFILAVLNSSIGKYLCSQYVSILDDGGYLMQKIYIEKIPIPKPNTSTRQQIEENLNSIEAEESYIDDILFRLFDLTIDEIEFIQSR
nr:TaqI-like C-terminal specificity domain-containing protein [uncultured Flavobacterium sp.]